MSINCEILFDNPDRVFYAGQLLSGTVRLTLTKQYKVRGVYIQIFGKAYAHWTEYCSIDHSDNYSRNNEQHRTTTGHSVSYTGEQLYLDEKSYFVGGPNAQKIQLPPGTQNYKFQCNLPFGLPTSVEHEVGHITYGVKLVMDVPFWLDTKFKEHFTVIKPINLNEDPSFRCPANNKEIKVFYPFGLFCCCPSGPLSIDVYAPVSGYTPGQTINVKVNVVNDSNESISRFNVQLVKEITFNASGYHNGINENKQKVVYDVIEEELISGCSPGQKDINSVNLKVPSIPPTDYSTSSIVQVKYLIHVDGTVDACCRENVKCVLPITIGTYPIQDSLETLNTTSNPANVITHQPTAPILPMEISAPNAPSIPTQMPIGFPPLPNQNTILPTPSAPSFSDDSHIATSSFNPNDDPPTYEEAMMTDGQNSNNFIPKYPMFKRQTSYSTEHK